MEKYIRFSDIIKLEKKLENQFPNYKDFQFKSMKDEFGNSVGFSVSAERCKHKKERSDIGYYTFSDIRYLVTGQVTPIYDSPNICEED